MNSRLILSALVFLFLIPSVTYSQTPRLWGDLQPGPFAVGYRTILTHDLSRASIVDSTLPSSAQPEQRGRPMQINVWYPARSANRKAAMRFADYVHLLARRMDFRPLTEARKREAEQTFITFTGEMGRGANALEAKLAELMKMEMAASENAVAAPGRFPLLLFPEYRAPASHSLMCEYLASHGFVVAATGMKGTWESDFDLGVTGVETQIVDLQFVLGVLNGLPMVNPDKVVLIGLGISANSCLGQQMRNPMVDAVISLDGGILSPFEDSLLKRTPYYDPAAVRVPLLAIYAPHPSLNPQFLNQYKYSTRYLVHFPKMSEYHFLNFGMIERFVPGVIGAAPGDTKVGFEWACRYSLHFLKAYLQGEAESLRFLQNSPTANHAPAELLTINLMAGLMPPPTLPELKARIRQNRMQEVVALYRELRQQDPQPFSQERFGQLINWLASGQDPDFRLRKEVAVLRVDSFPQSARAHNYLAGIALQLSDRPLAARHYAEALRLLENDPDPALDSATKKRLEQSIRQALKTLE